METEYKDKQLNTWVATDARGGIMNTKKAKAEKWCTGPNLQPSEDGPAAMEETNMGQARQRAVEIAKVKEAGRVRQAGDIDQNTVALWIVEFGDGRGNFSQMLYKTADGYEVEVRTRYYVDDKLFEESKDEKHLYTIQAKVPTTKEQWIEQGRQAAQNIAKEQGTRCEEAIMTGDYKAFVATICSWKNMHVQQHSKEWEKDLCPKILVRNSYPIIIISLGSSLRLK